MAQSHDRASESLAGTSVLFPQLELAPLGADPLSEVLRVVKLSGALFFLVDASFPWGIEIPPAVAFATLILPRAQHVVSYHIVLEGAGWVCMQGIAPARFEAGDILVFPHGNCYSMLSEPGQKPEFDSQAAVEFLREMAAGRLPFVVKEGGGGTAHTRFVCGYLGCDIQPFNPVLTMLPNFLHVRRPDAAPAGLLARLIELTLMEAQAERIGGRCIRLRLSELMFVEVVRRYFENLPVEQAGWLSGLRDPAIGRILSMLHEQPEYPWNLNELAKQGGLSRAILAERFTQLVGYPPIHYLALWRMQIAARRLADTSDKVADIANQVGYASEAAFSRAFKRVAGCPPADWRSRHAELYPGFQANQR